MATSGSFNTSYVGNFYFTFAWSRTGYDSSKNEHYIYYELIAHNSAGNYRTVYLKNLYINDSQKYYTAGSSSSGKSYYDGDVVTSGTMTIPSSNSSGDGSVWASFEAGVGSYPGSNVSGSGSWSLDRIPRYATSNQSLKSKSSSSISMNWSSDSTIDYIWYSTNNGSNWTGVNVADGTSGSYTISGLSANTTYKIKTRVRRKDSQLTTDSSSLSVTTYKKTTPTISLSSRTVNSIKVSSGCNVSVSSTKYRIKQSGGSYGSYQTSATFTGLTPNTAYIIEVYKVGTDSGEAGTATLNASTYDIARLTSYPNFNLGDNLVINYTNPASAPIQVGIYDTNGAKAYAPYREATGSSYTFNFTDEELDTIYKDLGNSNSIKVNVYINTNANTYRDYKTITITLTGNQKTAHINNGTIKRAKVFIGKKGVKRCVVWVGANQTARRCI